MGCVNTNLKEIGPFFTSFKKMGSMDKLPFKMGVLLDWSLNMGTFCLHVPFHIGHIFYSRTTILTSVPWPRGPSSQSKVENIAFTWC